ncbi:MAG: 4-hydroxythreonine-4-phosphate dehydrogenase PdxA [Acetobacteraceae bacterium]|nr:4-hydroxythreonine-4-phosphate dehydrogenase PdxA [Acetobacteraceae bacterium]
MTDTMPLLAVTMGDPAGIGPEITVKAMLAPEVRTFCRPVVVGDVAMLEQALGFCGITGRFNRIDSVAAARHAPGEIDVFDLGIARPDRLVVGAVQALGGQAAAAYIRKSIELANAGAVGAVVTAPINKEALKAARIPYIGHTEMFADLTGAREEMTMFAIGALKIFFLSRHVSLIEACRLVTRDRVLAGIEKAMRALDQLGIANAHLVVAALNPHGGEDGLFGREEVDEIVPAIAEARRRGYHVSGPAPADSVFHFAQHGRYDAVLSLYHDQGHIASKMIDFDRTVSVTLGLPIMRTSVDHGTAFDIAGTGKASAVSMIEALRVGACYAGRGVPRGETSPRTLAALAG